MNPKWTAKASPNGSEVVHQTTYNGCKCEVWNYPGTRTLIMVIHNRVGERWHSETLDKAECSVGGTKQNAIDWLDSHLQSDLKEMIDALEAAGWKRWEGDLTVWQTPSGGLFRGPAGAFRMMKAGAR